MIKLRFAHDLRKPVSTFQDHALKAETRDAGAAANIKHLPGDERACRIGEEHDGARNVVAAAETARPEWLWPARLARSLPAGTTWPNISVSSIGPGATTFTVMPARRELERPGSRHADHAGLGRRIDGAGRQAQRRARGDQHDAAVLSLAHARQAPPARAGSRRRDEAASGRSGLPAGHRGEDWAG